MSAIARPVVFSDTFPKIKMRSVALVLVAVVATALLAQVEINLGFAPVAITGTTLAVLLAGATLGSRLGAISMAAYAVAGLVLPIYADGKSGTDVLTGETGGYIFGGILAAYVVGLLAERLQDRTFLTAIPAMLFGSVLVYAIAVPWLVIVGDDSFKTAVSDGLAPFAFGDILKSLVAGALLPILWKLAKHDEVKAEA